MAFDVFRLAFHFLRYLLTKFTEILAIYVVNFAKELDTLGCLTFSFLVRFTKIQKLFYTILKNFVINHSVSISALKRNNQISATDCVQAQDTNILYSPNK